jgi:hypothetical protein
MNALKHRKASRQHQTFLLKILQKNKKGEGKNSRLLPRACQHPRSASSPKAAAMGSSQADKPLRRIAVSFEELAAVAKQQPAVPMDAGAFSRACSNVSVLFGCLGIAFKFAEMDYVAKARILLLPVSSHWLCTTVAVWRGFVQCLDPSAAYLCLDGCDDPSNLELSETSI